MPEQKKFGNLLKAPRIPIQDTASTNVFVNYIDVNDNILKPRLHFLASEDLFTEEKKSNFL